MKINIARVNRESFHARIRFGSACLAALVLLGSQAHAAPSATFSNSVYSGSGCPSGSAFIVDFSQFNIPFNSPPANASSNSIGYINYVNSLGLCGSSTWRLPTSSELMGWRSAWRAMDIGTRSILIPNVGLGTTWTSSPDVGATHSAWASSIGPDSDFTDVRWGSRFVRLVR